MKNVAAVVLAAGQGKRMKSALPKVAHHVAGKPMLWRVAAAARAAGISEIVFVLGHGREKVMDTAARFGGKVAVQARQLGTGDAARCGLAALSPGMREVVVLCGDAPLIRPATIRRLVAARRRRKAAASVLTGVLPDPSGYGRVLRNDDGTVARIVEERDGDEGVRKITEVNSGTYAFDREFLARNLPRLSDVNSQREYYLTDMVVHALRERNLQRQPEPAGGQHAQDVAMPEERDVASRADGLVDDPPCSDRHRLDRLPRRHALVPDGPARNLAPDLGRGAALVRAVVPFEEVVRRACAIGEAGEAAGLPCPPERAREDEREAPLAQPRPQRGGLLHAGRRQRDVGAPRVLPRAAPLGLAVADEP